ncbi:putative membrane protein YccC [Geomicrobium sediminis]|uniref:Membrane protein YccC n=1 Tax=Geomicrobium sediminis TaxID=1347788 RepID=A0ABS2PDI9_9BACL|nr:putative membrane protein YccC [Geomicrobium sediminis]
MDVKLIFGTTTTIFFILYTFLYGLSLEAIYTILLSIIVTMTLLIYKEIREMNRKHSKSS